MAALGCDITTMHMSTSRNHAKLRVAPDAVYLSDLSSTHGTRVRDGTTAEVRLLPPRVEVRLTAGARLYFGEHREYVYVLTEANKRWERVRKVHEGLVQSGC